MTLNRRHKAGLFLTLVAVGCGLFLEVSARQAVGIALLGIAFSWLIGSLTPRALIAVFAIVICGVGLYVAAAPVWSDWNSAQKSAAEYEVSISDLQYAVKTASPNKDVSDLPKGAILIPTRVVTIPDTTVKWMPRSKA
jgi:hypothetical protein